jgi:predicted amidohydrolase
MTSTPSLADAARSWRTLLFLAFFAAPAAGQELMPPTAQGWAALAPRVQTAPAVNSSAGSGGYSLNIFGNGVMNVYGGWTTRIQGLHGGAYYRFRARALPVDIASPRESLTILLRWRGAFGGEVAPDYVWTYRTQSDGTLLFDRVIQAPPGTTAVDVELVLQWSPSGRVTYDGLSFTPSAAPAARPVKIAAVYYRPSGTSSGQESVARAAAYAEQVAGTHRPDVMVLGELLNVIGAPGSLDSKAETIPGPSTDRIAGIANSYNVNIVFGMLERDGSQLYNTAVLLNRSGEIAGKYRKVQLPMPEYSAGIAPGDAVPVFDIDVGRIGLLICHDLSFPEPARETALQGAEMLLVPLWGGKAAFVRGRAVEHGMYVVVSGYDYPSEIVDPLGTALDGTTFTGAPDVAVATIDLSRRFRENWLGDFRDISNKERRTTPYRAGTTPPEPPPPPPPPDDELPPTTAIASPASGATVSGSVAVTANASDNVAVAHVELWIDGVLSATDTSSPYVFSWNTTAVANGTHTLQARAYDAAGNVGSSSTVTVNVSNASSVPPEIVLYAADATTIAGAWRREADATAAGGFAMHHPDQGVPKLPSPLATPTHYFELTFTAQANVLYHLWARIKAENDEWPNESVFIQFSSGTPYTIGTTSGADINLENCSGCGVAGWGWQDNGWGTQLDGPDITFTTGGVKTLRVQTREDGTYIDQIILSPARHLTTAPGPLKNDSTIYPRSP